jgi:hypothetical protein
MQAAQSEPLTWALLLQQPFDRVTEPQGSRNRIELQGFRVALAWHSIREYAVGNG